MTPVIIPLPDDVARAADEAGLLDPATVEDMFRARLGLRGLASVPAPQRRTTRGPAPGDAEPDRAENGMGWLPEALAELESVDEDIAEDGLPPIGPAVRSAARSLLLALRDQKTAPVVYPTEDAEIALYFKPPRISASVMVRLESGGGATWSALVPGHDANGRCEDLAELPLGVLTRSLEALAALTDPA